MRFLVTMSPQENQLLNAFRAIKSTKVKGCILALIRGIAKELK